MKCFTIYGAYTFSKLNCNFPYPPHKPYKHFNRLLIYIIYLKTKKVKIKNKKKLHPINIKQINFTVIILLLVSTATQNSTTTH